MKMLELCKFARCTNTYNRNEVWWQFRYFIHLHVEFPCSTHRAWIIFIASVIQTPDFRAWIRALYTLIIHAKMQPCWLCTTAKALAMVVCWMAFVSVSTSSFHTCLAETQMHSFPAMHTTHTHSIPNACDKQLTGRELVRICFWIHVRCAVRPIWKINVSIQYYHTQWTQSVEVIATAFS